jgi:hypothetical protein
MLARVLQVEVAIVGKVDPRVVHDAAGYVVLGKKGLDDLDRLV